MGFQFEKKCKRYTLGKKEINGGHKEYMHFFFQYVELPGISVLKSLKEK